MPTYTSSPTETLHPGDVVMLRGERYVVAECKNCRRFFLNDSKGYDSTVWLHLDLHKLTELVRQKFAELSPKEVPPLAVGQKWRTRGGKEVTINRGTAGQFAAKASRGDWFYNNHNRNKLCHSPGVFGCEHEYDLVELIADAPASEKSPNKDEVTLVLIKDEAQFLREITGSFITGNGPVRKHSNSIAEKLYAIGFRKAKDYPISLNKNGICCDEVKEPLFRLNEVWRTEKKYLVRVSLVRSDGTASVRTIHNPKGADILHGEKGTHEVSADGTIAVWNDRLMEKISD